MPFPENRKSNYGAEPWFHAVVFVFAFLVLFARRPDALLNAQFYAEDGRYWYADAYQYGWQCLTLPLGGYLNSISRLIGMFTLLFPLAQAPLIMNLFALMAAILPIHIFLSPRFDKIPFATRVFGSLLYLGLPNSFELHATTTNLHWHLALAGCLVLLGEQPAAKVWQIFDWVLLATISVAGPFGILLIPIAAFQWWNRRDNRYRAQLIALLPAAALQGFMIVFVSGAQRAATNGANLGRLTSIVGGQIFLSSILGIRTFIQFYYYTHLKHLFLVEAVSAAVGVALVLYAARFGPKELRLFLFFSLIVLSLGLARPLAGEPEKLQWVALQAPGCGNRYYFFPMLSFLASLIWMATTATPWAKTARYVAVGLLALLPIGVWRDWRYKPFVDYDFRAFAADFERSAPGTTMTVPINPGFGWTMQLTKR